jgi:acetyltransferase
MQILHSAHVPAFPTPEDAVSAYLYMHEYTKSLKALYETPADILPGFEPDRDKVKGIFAGVAHEGHTALTEIESKEVLAAYDIPVVETLAATTAKECSKAAEEIGCPVAVKILSRDIERKVDVGGLAKDVRSPTEAGRQFTKIMESVARSAPKAELLGVTVHAMTRGGHDVMIGSRRDSTFGPALMFGMGDSGLELYEDVAVDFPPINQSLARSMIDETTVSKLLLGGRGRPAVDTVRLERALVKFSYLLVDFPEIVSVEAKPFQVRPDGVLALDARIVIEPKHVRRIARPDSHLIISMYPTKYRQTVTVDSRRIEIRAIKPEDEPLWSEMIESLSDATAEYRFFGPVKEITKPMLVRYCHIDYDAEISLVAVEEGKEPRMLAVASIAIEEPGSEEGEFAIVVRDDCQRLGLGATLMTALIEAARDKYLRQIYGHVLASNFPMLRFVESLGFEIHPSDDPKIRHIVLHV